MFTKLNPPKEFFSAPQHERVEFFWFWSKEQMITGDVHFGDLSADQKTLFLNHLYKEGKLFHIVEVDFNEFQSRLASFFNRNHRGGRRYRRFPDGQWYYRHGNIDFRERMSYGRRPHHQKKVLSEQEVSRREWRDNKGFNRDRQKAYWYGSRKKWAKHFSNRSHRAMERQMIHRQLWDRFINGVPKDIFDPWDWD